METNQTSKTKFALNYGAMVGLIVMALTLITYVFEMYEASWMTYLSYVVLIAGIYISTKKFRDEAQGGFITYGKALGFGVLIALFSAIILAFINYIYLGFIDDSFLQYSIDKMEQGFYEAGTMSDEDIENALSISSKFVSPGFISISTLFFFTFVGFIISLITSAFLKNEKNEFDEI